MLPGIGVKTEESLWTRGIQKWEHFLEETRIKRISGRRKRYLDALLKQAIGRLKEPGFLATFFPEPLHWRLYNHLMERAVFLDIEINGLSFYSDITVVGVYGCSNNKMVSLVKGMNLTQYTLGQALKDAGIIVTFNGSSFDLPFIRRQFPLTLPEVPHFDLRFGARKLGLSGGLKALEKTLGITRDFEVENLAGEDALIYWRMWKKDGNKKALRLLRKYNREDVMNLIPLAGYIYEALKEKTLGVLENGEDGK